MSVPVIRFGRTQSRSLGQQLAAAAREASVTLGHRGDVAPPGRTALHARQARK